MYARYNSSIYVTYACKKRHPPHLYFMLSDPIMVIIKRTMFMINVSKL